MLKQLDACIWASGECLNDRKLAGGTERYNQFKYLKSFKASALSLAQVLQMSELNSKAVQLCRLLSG